MMWTSHQFLEVIVRVLPRAAAVTPNDDRRVYTALVYCEEPLKNLQSPDNLSRISQSLLSCRGLPLVGDESIRIRWTKYQEYIASFVEGEKGTMPMRDRLKETLSPGLLTLFQPESPGSRPLRVWWSCDSPEMEDMPWELIAYETLAPGEQIVFARGLAPQPAPLKPPAQPPLRIGLIYDPQTTHLELMQLFTSTIEGSQFIPLSGPVREALRAAVKENCDGVHLVADAYPTLSYEGVLYFHGYKDPELPAAEMAQMLSGSRILFLGLTAARAANADMTMIGGVLKPAVFRGFACVARWRGLTQTVIAPLGPVLPSDLYRFWHDFYAGLASSPSQWRNAFTRALANLRMMPVAIFLRHPYNQLFTRASQTITFANEQSSLLSTPQELQLNLRASIDAVTQLRNLRSQLASPPDSLIKFLDQEVKRQQSLRVQLEPWTKLGESEELL
jgi:hypothetical protein